MAKYYGFTGSFVSLLFGMILALSPAPLFGADNVSPESIQKSHPSSVQAVVEGAPEKDEAPPGNIQGDHPLSLQEAVEGALKNNVAIAVLEFNSKIKEQDILDKRSEFDPTLGLKLNMQEETTPQSSAFASKIKSREQDRNWDLTLEQKLWTGLEYDLSFSNNRSKSNSTSIGLNPQYNSDLQLNLTQPLLKNFGLDLNKREIYIASNDVKISDFDFEKQVIDIISTVENAYWDLVFSIDDLKVKQTSLERAKDFQRRVEAQVEVGTLAPLEILQAKSEVASREEFLLTAEDLIRDNEDNLKNLLNISFSSAEGTGSLLPADRPVMESVEINQENTLKNAMQKRPDYLSRKVDLENKNILVKYNENQIFPSVDLVGSLGLNGISGKTQSSTGTFSTGATSQFEGRYGQALSDLMATENFLWKVGVELSYPLGNRSAKSKLAAARLESAKLLLDIKDLEKTIVVEVREAVRQIKTDVKRVQAAAAARKLAEEKLSAEEKKYEVGLSTSFNVLQFQEDLAEEQSNELKAIIDYNKSLIKLRKVTGEALEYHDIKLSKNNDS